jgi:hypothetical protein
MGLKLITGEPGTSWENDTGKIWWQASCDFKRSCARCIALHHTIGAYFPFPLHENCSCVQRSIKPGQTAAPFIDYEQAIAELSPAQQTAAMGKSNWRLVQSGLAKFSDVVTPGRIRDFREVVDHLDLDVKQLTKAGVSRHQAAKAYDATHTAAHAAADTARSAIIQGLKTHGVKDERIVAEVAELLGQRVNVVPVGRPPGALPPPVAPKAPPRPLRPLPAPDTAPPPIVQHATPHGPREAIPPRSAPTPSSKSVPEPIARVAPKSKPIAPTPVDAPRTRDEHLLRATEMIEKEGIKASLAGYQKLIDYGYTELEALNTPAFFSLKDRSIYLNHRSAHWKDPAASQQKMGQSGWMSSEDPDHVINHEIGHFKSTADTGKNVVDNRSQSEKEYAARQVSQYAAFSGDEFVSEVYAGLKAGKKYDLLVMADYHRLGGPDL